LARPDSPLITAEHACHPRSETLAELEAAHGRGHSTSMLHRSKIQRLTIQAQQCHAITFTAARLAGNCVHCTLVENPS
jgi:hypothetical protein